MTNLIRKNGKLFIDKEVQSLKSKVLSPDQDSQRKEKEINAPYICPSDSPFPVFVLCQPLYVDTKIDNNAWMQKLNDDEGDLDKEKFMGEWFNLYNLLATESVVYLLPPKQGLQDQAYVNCFAYLPHFKEKPTVVLSNFTAEGRAGEEEVAGEFLSKLGYTCIKSPYKFEGDAELKYFKDDIYFGGYGIRTQKATYDWIQEQYGGNIIPIESHDEYLYHLDCLLFVLNKDNVMVCDVIDKATIKKIEKVATVHLVDHQAAMECVCNSIKVGDIILNASSLEFMQKRDPKYQDEWKKNKRLEEICTKLGLEIMYVQADEAGKSGAALSCFAARLNWLM